MRKIFILPILFFPHAKVLEVVADLSKENDVDKLVKETMERFENLDILINNAATAPLASLETVSKLCVLWRLALAKIPLTQWS